MGIRQKNKFKLKTNKYGFKRNSEPNQICSKFRVAEVKLEMDDIKITIRTTIEGTATETCTTNACS
jgi:uncharacterized protein (DUF2141 family)